MRVHLNKRNFLAVKRLNQNSLWASALLASAVLFAVLACAAQTPAKPDASTSSAAFLQLYQSVYEEDLAARTLIPPNLMTLRFKPESSAILELSSPYGCDPLCAASWGRSSLHEDRLSLQK